MNYQQYVARLVYETRALNSDVELPILVPAAIDSAEQRIYRDLDLLNTRVYDGSTAFSLNTRTFSLPTTVGTFQVVEQINVITPVGVGPGAANAVITPLVPMAKEVLDFLWPSVSGSTVPQYFAMRTQSSIIVGPWPDQTYNVEVCGTQQPATLSSANSTTLLTTYFQDLFLAASMAFASGFQKTPGEAPSAVNWEAHYQELLRSAQVEEARKKFTSSGWSSKQPAPLATPPAT